ncbi:MAG: peptidase and in kexin sedolisin [Frankiales bacterium]|nr:peptidase and in kexin sedolisin [Frankiales bacterium]
MNEKLSLQGVTWNDTKRSRRPAVVGALLTGLLASGLGAAPAALASGPGLSDAPQSVLVRATPGQLDEAAAAVKAAGGTVRRSLASLDTVTGTVPASALTSLRSAAGVAEVTRDSTVTLQGRPMNYSPKVDPNSVYNSLLAMGAHRYYLGGITGKGVDVAIIDSGVSPVEGLDAPGKLVQGPDLSEEAAVSASNTVDTNGHGTFLAGLIAGKDRDMSLGNLSGSFVGAAPDARVIAVKAANRAGATDVSQVMAGIDWVVEHKNANGMNIRVLNLSFGTDGVQGYQLDPLSHAVEAAWKKGIFVVVSAGNRGTSLESLTNPATNPFVVAVGAVDTHNTPGRADDTIPGFSSFGTETRTPDLVAPGKSVTSLRVPGSHADENYPSARVGERFFRGSGTSQAAAYISGAAALVIQQRPAITPDQLKELMTRTASKLPVAHLRAQGAGALNLSALYNAKTNLLAVQKHAPSTGLGTLEGARGTMHLQAGDQILEGEMDVFGRPFTAGDWAPLSTAGTAWTGGGLQGVGWSGVGWSGVGWSGVGWSNGGWGV